MFRRLICPVLSLIWMVFLDFAAFAGKVELSTYYPAPYGEYSELKSTERASFATSSGKVGIGTEIPSEKLDVSGNIKASGDILAGNSNVSCAPANAGAIRYSTPGQSGGIMQFCNGSAWQEMGSGTAPSGSWCGVSYINDGNRYSIAVNNVFPTAWGDIPCQGVLPHSGCPTGYSQIRVSHLGWHDDTQSDYIVTCVRQ